MWHIAIPAICVLAHLNLLIIFLPALWREIERQGFRWHHTVIFFVVPILLAALIAGHVLSNLDQVPIWLLVTALITIDAQLMGVLLTGVALHRRRRQPA